MFDRCYLINLKRRLDRLENFRTLQRQHGWELPDPIIFPAIDGDKVGVPQHFKSGGGAYGCLRSHVNILEQCVMDDVGSVLVMEDDCTWMPHIWPMLKSFMQEVPDDKQMVMLGGQHIKLPKKITDTVWRVENTQRTHGYAVYGDTIKQLLHLWYTCNVHIDWKMGDWQKSIKCYSPALFFFGQSGGRSDIAGKTNQATYWDWANEVHGNYLLVLKAPRSTIDNLHGFHRGYWLHANGQDNGLIEIATQEDKTEGLKKWINCVGKEADEMGSTPVIWHPSIQVSDVAPATDRTIIDITAESVDDFMEKWRKATTKEQLCN